MVPLTHDFGRTLARLSLPALALLAALFPPGPSAPAARAQGAPPAAPDTPHLVHLPLLLCGGSGAAPDLIFTPDLVDLAPGAEASVAVRVEPQADLTGASFELPGVQDGVTSRFEAAADGTSGTLTIEANEAAAADERALMVQGTSGNGAHSWVGSLKITTQPTAGARTLFVDPNTGSDTNDGSQAKPLKTLTKALAVVKQGDTIMLAGGVYSKATNGESFGLQPLLVPAGVTMIGTLNRGARASILKGTAVDNALSFQGDATMKDLDMRGFGAAVFTSKGKQTFSNLLLFENVLSLSAGSARTTLARSDIILSTNGEGAKLFGQVQLTMNGGSITGAGSGCDTGGKGISFSGSAQAMLIGAQFLNIHGPALNMRGASKATINDAAIGRTDGTCTGTVGITAQSSVSLTNNVLLTLKNTNISGYTEAAFDLVGNVKLVIDGGAISQNGIGINIDPTTIVDSTIGTINRRPDIVLTGVSLTGNQTGIDAGAGRSEQFKLRKSVVTGNGTGIKIRVGSDGCFIICADLGIATDPGGNTIQNNTITGVTFDKSITPFGGVEAADNTWNPLMQGTNISGFYPHVLVTGLSSAASGKNFDMPNGNFSIQL